MVDGWLGEALRTLVIRTLKAFDRLPRHVGIVMDGNRRYARRHGHENVSVGHNSGFESMSRVLSVAYSSGIAEVTVYAFSIENFSRTPEEVADLMNIARERLTQLISHQGLAEEYGVRINIIGKLELLPEDIQKLAHTVMDSTRENRQATLNLCMPYTAREDLAYSLAEIASEGLQNIDVGTIGKHLRTRETLPLDILVRTSGTHRLSDFLLWEITETTYLDFVHNLWPEYTPWSLFWTIVRWRHATLEHSNTQ